jgi:hypothetical protein
VTGGYRYRGAVYPEFYGQYVYGDYCSGRIWSARPSGSGWTSTLMFNASFFLSAFGEDEAGELYVLAHDPVNGAVYRIDASPMHDEDGDGCSDTEEAGTNPIQGGDRDPASPWDFYDVPAPPLMGAAPNGTRDRAVSLTDVATVLFYFGTTADDPAVPNANGAIYGSDWNDNTVFDGQEYDRTPSVVPEKPWRSGPPDGATSLGDAAVALLQFGHDCDAP